MMMKNDFMNILLKNKSDNIPIYCPGYPNQEFINNYVKKYNLNSNFKNLTLLNKDYGLIYQMGFDAISIHEFRCEKKYIFKENALKIDSWGRLYKNDWYAWDGVFKNEKTLQSWKLLKIPSTKKLKELKKFYPQIRGKLSILLSLPGLFEKSWQSMGFIFFSKLLKKKKFEFINEVINFFYSYTKRLIKTLQKIGIQIFIFADDCGYNQREFIPVSIWRKLFLEKYIKLVEIIHEKNGVAVLHSDGYIINLMDSFIEIGFDAIQSLEPNSGVNIFELFRKYKDKICFIGNIDITYLIYWTPIEIKEYVEKLISKARRWDCFLIVSPTQQINSTVNPENVRMMIKTVKEFNIFQ